MQLPGGDIACAFGGSDDDDLSAIWRVLKQNSRIRVEPGVPPRSRALPGGARWGVVTVRSISSILLLNIASFALLPSPEWCAQASQGESVNWIETRRVVEDATVERFLLERENTQAPHDESVKGPNTQANMPSCLKSSLDPIPVSCDDRLSGPERNQLATPCWAHEEGPECRSTTVVKPLPDRVSPHLEE